MFLCAWSPSQVLATIYMMMMCVCVCVCVTALSKDLTFPANCGLISSIFHPTFSHQYSDVMSSIYRYIDSAGYVGELRIVKLRLVYTAFILISLRLMLVSIQLK